MRAVLALLPLIAACERGDTEEPLWDPEYDALAAAVEAARTGSDSPAAAFAVFDADGIRFAAGFGALTPEGVDPVGPDSRFRIGSVTKALTAAAVLSLAEEGKLELDAPVTSVLPDFVLANDAERSAGITIRHLLTHESGLWEYTELDGDASDAGLAAGTQAFAEQGWLLAPPGTFWNYSNTGYAVAGRVAEAADGRTYRELMSERVFAPLGFERAAFTEAEVLADADHVVGLGPNWETGRGERAYGPADYDSAFSRPAGFAWLSVTDLARWGQYVLRHEDGPLSQASWEAQRAAHVDLEYGNPADHYGLGLIVSDGFHWGDGFVPTPLLSHGGDIPGFSADIWVLPELGIGFAALNARSGAHLTDVLGAAFDLVELPAKVASPMLPWDPASVTDFEGTWNDPFNAGDLILTVEDGVLTVEAPLLDEYQIPYDRSFTPYAADNLVWGVQGTELVVSFIRDSEGEPAWLRTRAFAAERVPDAARSARPRPDPAALRAALAASPLR